MAMNITEKILANHSGNEEVVPGQLVDVNLDLVYAHDVTGPPAFKMMENHGWRKVFDPEKVVLAPDHFVPPKDIQSAELYRIVKDWGETHHVKNFYPIGRHGIAHIIVEEQGYVTPGMTIISADSHTVHQGAFGAFATGVGSTDLAAALYTGKLWFRVPESMKFVVDGKFQKGVYSKDLILKVITDIKVDGALYKAMEWQGSGLKNMSMDARTTLTNMAIEAGAKSGIMNPDEITIDYVKTRTKKKFTVYKSDDDADYSMEFHYNLNEDYSTH
jgi:3-isopropylmalate/(R)-2-methylmalate dehydratase large subunit